MFLAVEKGHVEVARSLLEVGGCELVMIVLLLFLQKQNIGTQFSILYTSMYSPAEAATPRA